MSARACERCGDRLASWREGQRCGDCLAPERVAVELPGVPYYPATRGRTEGQRAKLGRTS